MNPVKATKHTDFGKGIKVVGCKHTSACVHMYSGVCVCVCVCVRVKVSGQPVVLADEEDVVDEEEEEEREFEQQLQQWKKTEVSQRISLDIPNIPPLSLHFLSVLYAGWRESKTKI